MKNKLSGLINKNLILRFLTNILTVKNNKKHPKEDAFYLIPDL
ncbi:hypothetical protein J705_1398 [Acinetobacter baumannii 1505311]|jgi:hypothetical protein|nr:hypothetical protein J705_1398 [Acinetobacter baumannii 1505311]